jgi:hypothetical protein
MQSAEPLVKFCFISSVSGQIINFDILNRIRFAMKNSFISKLTLSLIVTTFGLCQFAQAALFPLDEETREIGEFHAVDAGGLVEVYLQPGDETSVRVRVRRIDFDEVITRVEDGVLVVSTVGNHRGETVRVHVTYTQLDGVHVRGAAEIHAEGVLEADTVEVSTHGAGDIKSLAVKADRLDISINNAGNADIEVDTDSLFVEMHDAGDLRITGVTNRQNVRSFGSRGSLNNGRLEIREN